MDSVTAHIHPDYGVSNASVPNVADSGVQSY